MNRYGGKVAIQYEGEDKVEPENLVQSLAQACDMLERNYAESVALLGLDKTTTALVIDYDHGKGQYVMSWEASK